MSLVIPTLKEYWLIANIEHIDRKKNDILSLHDWHPEDTDGKISLEEYLTSRINAWLDVIAISDHNTLETNNKAIELTEKDKNSEFYNKIKLIPSIELSLGGKFPGHIILLDFDIGEFSDIFYEKYLFEYLHKFFPNRNKLSPELRDKIVKWQIRNFQPSQLEKSQDTAYILEAIIAMKNDSAYEMMIFPWDTPNELFSKLMFHHEKWNIKKFPIIQIPHPTLWKKVSLTNAAGWIINRHIKSLEKLWLTTYWWIASSKEARKYIIDELSILKQWLENKWGKLNLLYEIHNDKDATDKEWTTLNRLAHFKELWAIACIGFDWHEEKTPELWIVVPKWISFRDYINSEEFTEKDDRELQFAQLEKWVGTKNLRQRVRAIVSDILFIRRWNTDPLCNEFPNLDLKQEWLEVYHVINELDTDLVNWSPEMLNTSVSITDKNIKDYKAAQKRWRKARKLQKKFINSKKLEE